MNPLNFAWAGNALGRVLGTTVYNASLDALNSYVEACDSALENLPEDELAKVAAGLPRAAIWVQHIAILVTAVEHVIGAKARPERAERIVDSMRRTAREHFSRAIRRKIGEIESEVAPEELFDSVYDQSRSFIGKIADLESATKESLLARGTLILVATYFNDRPVAEKKRLIDAVSRTVRSAIRQITEADELRKILPRH